MSSDDVNKMENLALSISDTDSVSSIKKPSRRLRPEVAAAFAARRRETQLEEFYRKPVDQLEPEELAIMRAAFFGR
jgi:hypothetical protein